jgi:alkaline phosphatase D
MNKRDLLRLAVVAAGAHGLPGASWAQARIASDPFTLGVASGSPLPDGMVLWTRLLPTGLFAPLGPESAAVRWELARDDQFKQIVRQGSATASAELAHSVHVEVSGLQPDQWYFYRFHAGDYTSPVGRTRTAPAADAPVGKLRLAYASCQRWEHGYYSAYRHMAQEQLDLVSVLGDYIYEYPGAANAVRHVSGGWVQGLADYRARYALHKSDPDLQAMHAVCPWLLSWDDHEVHNDYAADVAGYTGTSEGFDPSRFTARKAAAYQAWYEHMPVRSSVLTRALGGLREGAELRIHHSLHWGRLAQLLLLDPRQYRSPQVCTRDGRLGSSSVDVKTCPALQDPARSMLGAAQEAWMAERLQSSSAGWQVIGQGSLLGARNFRGAANPSIWNDGWDGYPAARGRFTAALAKVRMARGSVSPVVLGGDVHENWVGQIKADYADAASASVGAEFCGTSITSRSGNAARSTVDGWLAENKHFQFADNQAKGYGVCEFTPAKLTTTLRAVDDVTRKDAAIHTLAEFAVQSGQTKPERST